jgi:hypothetical protein
MSTNMSWAGPKDWDQHKNEIERLYVSENRTLKDVMATMERDYGHRAT